jgi:hypothetical protein
MRTRNPAAGLLFGIAAGLLFAAALGGVFWWLYW